MRNTCRLTLLGSALLAAVTLAPAAEATPTSAPAVVAPQDAFSAGHSAGYRQGMRDGRLDCVSGRHRRMHFSPPSMGRTRYSRGFAMGYRAGYRRMCG